MTSAEARNAERTVGEFIAELETVVKDAERAGVNVSNLVAVLFARAITAGSERGLMMGDLDKLYKEGQSIAFRRFCAEMDGLVEAGREG